MRDRKSARQPVLGRIKASHRTKPSQPDQQRDAWDGWDGYPLHHRKGRRMTNQKSDSTESLPTLYTPEEVAKRLGRSGWWVREQCRRDRFPHTRAAGAIRFTRDQFGEVLQILERRPETSNQGIAAVRSPNRKAAEGGKVLQLRARPPRRARPVATSDDLGRTA